MVPKVAEVVNNLNTGRYCGISNWAINEGRSVLGTNCIQMSDYKASSLKGSVSPDGSTLSIESCSDGKCEKATLKKETSRGPASVSDSNNSGLNGEWESDCRVDPEAGAASKLKVLVSPETVVITRSGYSDSLCESKNIKTVFNFMGQSGTTYVSENSEYFTLDSTEFVQSMIAPLTQEAADALSANLTCGISEWQSTHDYIVSATCAGAPDLNSTRFDLIDGTLNMMTIANGVPIQVSLYRRVAQ
jgi:hypothetical protein